MKRQLLIAVVVGAGELGLLVRRGISRALHAEPWLVMAITADTARRGLRFSAALGIGAGPVKHPTECISHL